MEWDIVEAMEDAADPFHVVWDAPWDDDGDDVQEHAKTHQPAQSFNAYILRFPKVRETRFGMTRKGKRTRMDGERRRSYTDDRPRREGTTRNRRSHGAANKEEPC